MGGCSCICLTCRPGNEIAVDRIEGENGNLTEPSAVDNPKTDKKSEKKKKVVFGKGTAALMQFLKDRLLGRLAKSDLEKFAQDFLSLLDPKGLGFDDLHVKVKEIV